MRIAIDARMVRPGSMHGIARYVFQLLESFAKITPDHSFFVLVNEASPLLARQWPTNFHFVSMKSSWISFREQVEIPMVLKSNRIDLYHSPSFVAPLFCPCTMLMTIHDLNHLVLPQFYTPAHLIYYHFFVKSCVRRSRFIFTVSHFSKSEIMRYLKVDPAKICVTYNGVSDHYKEHKDPSFLRYIKDLYELPREFIFCLSNNKPHKNIHQLVRAFCFSDIDIPLVIASEADISLIKLAEKYEKKHLLHFSRFISEKHLPVVYSMARLFVYPSTYEGFGLPPLEALACGAKVVVAKSASLPEIVGSFATFVNPYDFQDIAQGLHKALLETKKEESFEARKAHCQKYSWKKMADQTLSVYERCGLNQASLLREKMV